MVLDTPPPPLRCLVLDAQYCHALAAVRSLGRRGAVVDVASHKTRAQGFQSRFRADAHLCPDPNREHTLYVNWLLDRLRSGRYDATFAFEEATADILSDYRDTVRHYTGCPLPERDAFLTASRKDQASQLARELGVRVPRTHTLQHLDELETLASDVEFPVVVKGVASSGSQQVAMAHSASELSSVARRIADLRRNADLPLPLVQEYVPGTGYGLTALVRAGQPIATFMHRREAEHDIASGVRFAHGASGATSVWEPELQDAGTRILHHLSWTGIAMVEFKRHERTGEFYFIEINPRFVGSLELAIAAGVDFPWLYAQLAAGRPVTGPTGYRTDLTYRWLISKNVANAFEHAASYWLGVVASLLPGSRTDLSLSDPLPHWSHLRNAAWWVRDHLRQAVASESPEPTETTAR